MIHYGHWQIPTGEHSLQHGLCKSTVWDIHTWEGKEEGDREGERNRYGVERQGQFLLIIESRYFCLSLSFFLSASASSLCMLVYLLPCMMSILAGAINIHDLSNQYKSI